jgi:hypothetical protein
VASRPQGPVRASCAAARLVRTVCGAAVRRRILSPRLVTPKPKAQAPSVSSFLRRCGRPGPRGRSARPAPETGRFARALGCAFVHRSPIATGHPL